MEDALVLDRYGVTAVLPVRPLVVEQRCVAGEPLGLVEIGACPGPTTVIGPEPTGPVARVLTGNQAWWPGGPGVRVLPALGHGAAPGSWALGHEHLASMWRLRSGLWRPLREHGIDLVSAGEIFACLASQ